ncbi:MAG: TonB-dependent receptor [Bacteroidales bacterium]|nr:TonB-dependent receptor [Bacteroidales bacterium]
MIATIVAATMLLAADPDTCVVLSGTTIYGESRKQELMSRSLGSVEVGRNYLENHFSGTLMQRLRTIPGVQSRSIGSGQSKPAIRGLGFNRIAVAVDGIKHEGQQWGDDHGLEIDAFSVDRVEVVKGPGALLYGSDAIGGVLGLYTNYLPTGPVQGKVQFSARSNNEWLGLSARVEGRQGRFYYRFHLTGADYGDYRVPVDSIQYYSYNIPLKDGRLRNTAGRERDGSLALGYVGKTFRNDLTVSDTWSKSGFFANAHGLEVRLSDIDYDRSRRDIDLPWQRVNHLTVHDHAHWHGPGFILDADLAWQHNARMECSEPVSHGYMPTPPDAVERAFRKHTLTAKAGVRIDWTARHRLLAGVDAEYQHNRRSGWGFIIPDFETASGGLYAVDRWTLSDDLVLNAGLRFDGVRTRIQSYQDWYETLGEYKLRSEDLRKTFRSLTWSAGAAYSTGPWVWKMNAGKSFRVPIPKELGADGVNYHIFRYEKGNPALDPEQSYQMDVGINYAGDRLNIQVDPYLNWFPNYIYLNPTSGYYEGLQMYAYTQCAVLRYGFEVQASLSFGPHWETEIRGEYLHAEQLSGAKKGYTLPFSPPWTADALVRYILRPGTSVQMDLRLIGDQREIVPPEKPTDGSYTLNATVSRQFPLGKTLLKVNLQVENLLDRRYYDHTSYYRLIGVPEPGRNASLLVGLEF